MALDTEQLVRVLMAERNKLLAYCWSIAGDFNLCEDIVQEVALLALDKGREVADETRLKVWLRRAARFKSLEALRRKHKMPPQLSDEVLEKLESHWEPYDCRGELAEVALAEMLRICFQRLTGKQRRLLSLRYAKQLRSGEIAERLGMKVDTVYRAITRAHRNLADCMDEAVATKRRADGDE
ncbi:MAG: sigma-70 family RNA polymerase sigma factor [Pirellulaceae bacterium]|nr:sigma-70 family RNA polymerase sigma factor [Pirellulaceae bacterium]